jgi:hypothetical protein
MQLESVVTQYERRAPLKAVANEETRLRMVELDATPAALAFVEAWGRVLELSLIVASLHDAVLQLGLVTCADVDRELQRVDQLVVLLSRLDPKRVVTENAELLRPFIKPPAPTDPATVDTATIVRTTRSLLLNCPIAVIERMARDEGLAQPAHRCRLAYDGLKAFVARHSAPEGDALATAGHIYAEGRASIDEVASMLGREVADVAALLEENGYRRSIDGLRLTDEERAQRLAQIRADRIARGGKPREDRALAARETIASQRIEGIDARPWLRS